jgi:DNA modification methylase
MTVTLHLGDCLEVLRDMDADTVQTCVTSPPYYGLRDYGHKGQIGQEETPDAYIARLVEVFREVRRVLKPDGTLWLNLGDSYAGSNQGAGTKLPSEKQLSNRGTNYQTTEEHKSKLSRIDGYKPKDLLMIPARVAIALQADGWYLRSEIVWHKPNPMPESVKDRPTKAHEMIYLLAKSPKYFYDAEAVLEPYTSPIDRWGGDFTRLVKSPKDKQQGNPKSLNRERDMRPNKNGRNRRDVWTVTTKPYKGAHFATFPPDLIEPCILAGSREGDVVLDPFNGAGTTGKVALKHERRYVGIDINPKYLELTRTRLELI